MKKKVSRAKKSTTPDSKIPSGPIESKWSKHKMDSALINPANRRKFSVIVVGSGLAGASAAATLSELGYKVKCFCYQDSPRRAHSLPLKEASMLQKIIKMTETVSTGSFMTP